jgi:uncharacterized protein (DUF1330 family)
MTEPTGGTILVIGKFAQGYADFFEKYSEIIRNYLSQFKMRIIRRQKIDKTIYGDTEADLLMLIDFDDIQVARTAFLNHEYRKLILLRYKVFSKFQMYLARGGTI